MTGTNTNDFDPTSTGTHFSTRPFRDQSWYRHSGAVNDRWYFQGLMVNSTALSSGTVANNTLFGWPWWSGRGGKLDRIAVNVVTGGASSQCRIGIYTNSVDGTNYPKSLLVDSGALDTSVSSTFKSATISQYVEPNQLYWLAYVQKATAPTMTQPSTIHGMINMGLDNALATNCGLGWKVSFTFGALPDPFTAAGSVATTSDAMIAVAVRYV